MNYVEFDFTVEPVQPYSEILITQLAELGFDSFVETETGFLAYLPETNFSKEIVKQIGELYHSDYSVTYQYQVIKQQNWNKIWEDNFKPVVIADKCAVRATFHESLNYPYEIIVDPKMAFGTGHHETTSQVMEYMLSVDFKHKKVADIGCGTGILGILASKLGADSVLAIDNDELCYDSTLENSFLNAIENITVYKGTVDQIKNDHYGIVIANINKNVILADLHNYCDLLERGGLLILSGFYDEGCADILKEARKYNLNEISRSAKNKWTRLTLQKNGF